MGVIFHLFVIFLALAGKVSTKRREIVDENEYLEAEFELGLIKGQSDRSVSGRKFWKFRGIPYAVPPIDALRFDEPLAFRPRWEIVLPTTEYRPNCIAFDNFDYIEEYTGKRMYKVTGDENCLYLNIHTHSLTSKNAVIFFVNGNGFGFGGPSQFDPHYLMDKDIVHVNFGYRLGPLGFLSTGDKVVPGNMGLKDQLVALQWVNKHIGKFGGDENRISLSGFSSGAVSVHFMYMSPLTKGLFHNGYSYSGSALCPWAIWDDIPSKTKKLAAYVNCTNTSSKVMVECMKLVTARKLVQQMAKFKVFLFNPFTIFGPIVDVNSPKPYLPEHPEELLKKGKFQNLPWISGFTAEDGLYPGAEFIYNSKQRFHLGDFRHKYLPHIFFYNKDCKKNVEFPLVTALTDYQQEHERSLQAAFLQLMTEHLYVVPALKSAAYMAKRNLAKAYLYSFMYRGPNSFSQALKHHEDVIDSWWVSHGDDTTFVYRVEGFNTRKRVLDEDMSNEMINLAVTFAQSSSLPESFEMWEPVDKNTTVYKFKYLEISSPFEYSQYYKTPHFLQFINEYLRICRN